MGVQRTPRNVQDKVLIPWSHALLTGTGVRAFLSITTAPSTNCNSVVEAITPGVAGNSIGLTFVAGGAEALDESAYPEITYTFVAGVTTVADFESKIAAESSYLRIATAGTPANVLAATVDEFSSVNLASGAATATRTDKIFKATRRMGVHRILYINETGIAEDALDHVSLEIKSGTNQVAIHSTETGVDGTIAADTFTEFTLGTAIGLAVGDVLSLVLAENAELTNIPAGRFLFEVNYLE